MRLVNRFIVSFINLAILLCAGMAQALPAVTVQPTASPTTNTYQQRPVQTAGVHPYAEPLYWYVSGNAATNPQVNFIGTIDGQPLVFKTSNLEQMRIGADGVTWLRRLLIGYAASGGGRPQTPSIEFYSPPYNVSISSPSPGMLSIGRQSGATGVALEVNGDVRTQGKISSTGGIVFPDGTVQTTAKINKGDKGDPGPAGPPGPQGPAGSGGVIAGEIDATGRIVSGKGFTVVRTATGFYEIAFPGGAVPICTATLNGGYGTDIRCGRSFNKIIISVYLFFNNKIEMRDQGFSLICAMQ